MARKRALAQPPLFHREVPRMPEGYYSSGPNPNLRRFVEEHATPCDPATDDYDVPPFDRPITTTKATAIYNMHTYWSKKPHDAIQQYIRHYTKPGDLVLDPFCGSGSTALAALMEGRAAIAIDLSPAATFITKNYCAPVDPAALQRAFEELAKRVKPEMDWLYETRCDRCDGRATTAYTVYSYVFQCPRCLEKVPLSDCVDAEGQTASGKPKKIKVCPHCHGRGHVEEISTRSPRFDAVPVLVSYLCEEGCTPKRGERRHDDPDPKKREYFEKYDLGKLREVEGKEIPHWYPPHRMMNVESDTEPWGDKWRAGTSNFRTVAELFTKRNLWALAAWMAAANQRDDDRVRFGVSSLTLGLSRMCRYDSRWSFPYPLVSGTYYVPQISKEMNAFLGVVSKINRTLARGWQATAKILEPFGGESVPLLISTQSCTDLGEMPSESVAYIFTDPPYGNNVQYGELNFIWEAWLGLDTHWHNDEIIVNNTRGMKETGWARMLRLAMQECYRTLRPGRWLSLCYHDTSEGTWQLIQDLMTEIGFIPEQLDSALFIDTGGMTYNQNVADKVTKRDLVINFRKPRHDEVTQLVLFGDEDTSTFREKALAILREALEAHPGSTADRLYDELVSRMVRKGEFERHHFEELLRQVAEPVSEPVMQNLFEARSPDLFGGHEVVRWYLLETAGQVDEAESKKEIDVATRLEAFMTRHLAEYPAETGVHYSDLFEQYLPIKDKPRRLLIDWLPEFFFKTADGTWRPPASDEERVQKESLRASGTLRQIKRFTRALAEGVPPGERDRPGNVATAADWVRQCRRAGLYDLGRLLYEKGGFDFATLSEEAAMEVEEDYQVCVRRSGG